jgi:ribonuclease Z
MSARKATSSRCVLRCFGVGEGWPCAERRHASFHYHIGSTRLVIDCGDGLSGGYRAAGLGGEGVDHLVLSHMHSDHVGGFSMFIQGLWLERRRKPLYIHAPASAIPALRAWLKATLLPEELIGFPIHWNALQPGLAIECGGCTLTPFPTRHLDSLKRKLQPAIPAICFEAYSFLIQSPKVRIAHTADIGQVSDLEPLLTEPLDLLVSELSHVSPGALFRRLRTCTIRRIVWVHLSRRLWKNRQETGRTLVDELGTSGARIARDGDIIRL